MKEMDSKRKNRYNIAYMNMAIAMAQLSYAVRKKVGCVIVSNDDQVIAQGYNGTPSGFDNRCENDWCDFYGQTLESDGQGIPCALYGGDECECCHHRTLKTKKEVLHAETNAIAKCSQSSNSSKGCSIYVTLSPCIDCAKSIIQAGIKTVYYLESYVDDSGIQLLKKNGVKVIQIDPGENYISPNFIDNL